MWVRVAQSTGNELLTRFTLTNGEETALSEYLIFELNELKRVSSRWQAVEAQREAVHKRRRRTSTDVISAVHCLRPRNHLAYSLHRSRAEKKFQSPIETWTYSKQHSDLFLISNQY